MKFVLKDYQFEAVDQLLTRLQDARSAFRSFGRTSSVGLAATTGAGKTVMSAAVIEALFHGSDEFEVEPDEGAVVLWFSDDPALNEQTRNRLMVASDKLSIADLVTIEPPFDKVRLDPGKVYFLNAQKLSTSSLLTRGANLRTVDDQLPVQMPDDQAWTIWQTLQNTIDDPTRTLYLFVDEAHRGFGAKPQRGRETIVQRLVNGSALMSPVPIVVGISATLGRFSYAMGAADFSQQRSALPAVEVDGGRVQESGLLKDTVVLDFTTEQGVFDRSLVRRAAEKLKAATEGWAEYAEAQQDPTPRVVPLLVLQLPNKPDPTEVGASLDVIAEIMPEVTPAAVRHVLGEHSVQRFGSWDVDWIEPQLVQDRTGVRVLVAKEAISTGWDCPRAEVMVSFRTAKEHTHITQILGRMVRNPLARRVPGDDRLNSVDCLLPHFDRTTAGKVVRFLTGQVEDVPGDSKRVLVDGRETDVNPAFPPNHTVWDAWRGLPTELLPVRGVRPVSRTLQFATLLEADGIRPGAVTELTNRVLAKLDAGRLEFADQFTAAKKEIETVHGQSIAGRTGEKTLMYSDFTMSADDQAVAIAYREARVVLSDVARAYVHRNAPEPAEEFTNPERDAMVDVSALATCAPIRAGVDQLANALYEEWEHAASKQIAAMSDLRREEYSQIRAQAPDPQPIEMIRPRVRVEDFVEVLADETTAPAKFVTKHLMSDAAGNFPLTKLNAWERRVVRTEVAKASTVAWYRNPPRSAGDSLCIAYRNEVGNWRGMYPDFVFFEDVDGRVLPSICDPHRFDLDDALPKLQALANYAAKYGASFHRIESMVELNGKPWALDLKNESVRKDVKYWSSEASLAALYTRAGRSLA